MSNFDKKLVKKPYIICISKSDLNSNRKFSKYIYISSFTKEGIKELVNKIFEKL